MAQSTTPSSGRPGSDLSSQIDRLRDASRRTVRELGMLEGRYAAGGVTHSQCHSLVELERRGELAPAELAAILRLDRSSVTRLVAPLIQDDLVRVAVDPRDQRGKQLSLTPGGRTRVDAIHAGACAQVEGALALLAEGERATVVQGFELYAAALERSRRRRELVVRPIRRRDDPDVAHIVRSVMGEFACVGEGFSIMDAEIESMSAAYRRERSAYFVAECDGRVIGGGGIAPLDGGPPEVCELRKMYLVSEARGLGAGRALLERCLESARSHGFARCYLETIIPMRAAHGLYESAGFQPLEGPMGNTGHFMCDRWMILDL